MNTEDNDWEIGEAIFASNSRHIDDYYRDIKLNGEVYRCSEGTACIAHALLLLLDSLNDFNDELTSSIDCIDKTLMSR